MSCHKCASKPKPGEDYIGSACERCREAEKEGKIQAFSLRESDLEMVIDEKPGSASLEASILRGIVKSAIDASDGRLTRRAVFMLRVGGMSYREIAEATKSSIASVQWNLDSIEKSNPSVGSVLRLAGRLFGGS